MSLTSLRDKFLKIESLKCLKLIYSLIYIKLCVLIASIHFITNLNSYTEQLDIKSLSARVLNNIVDSRGFRNPDIISNVSENLVELVKNSGAVFESELSHTEIINPVSQLKIFNSAGEFLESVEDSKDKVWLVQIVTGTSDSKKFLDKSTWLRLSKLSKFGILTGTFNCENDPYFCHLKNWHRSQLVLGLVKYDPFRYPKELVELYTYDDIKNNNYETIFEWLENMLTQKLVLDFPMKNEKNNNLSIDIFYIQKNSTKLPIYYSAMSVKYNKRANFYKVNNENLKDLISKCNLKSEEFYLAKTPIYVIIDKTFCYNYGTNLNELPNYIYLNQFLLFLHPDLNSIFLASFLFLNLILLLTFFTYKKSLLKQIAFGLIYLCLFNLILITLWLLTTNSLIDNKLTKLNASITYVIFKFLKWLRVLLISNRTLQMGTSFIRFITFYFFYLNCYQAIFLYLLLAIVFYFHTRKLSENFNKTYLPLKQETATSALIPRQLNVIGHYPLISNQDIDLEIRASELINQINGLTTIWLQSSTYADRLLTELPFIEYCKCFYANRVKVRAFDETDREETTTEDEEKMTKDKCECGKNMELNRLIENGEKSRSFFSKFHHECTICLQKYSFGNFIIVLPCGHLFHKKCIYEWFMNSINYKCPVCRTSFYRLKKSI